MTTNTQITIAIFQLVKSFATTNSLDVAYPGKKFKTPDAGNWLELLISPNDLDETLSDQGNDKRGMFQINVCGKPDKNPLALISLSEDLTTYFNKTLSIVDRVIVSKTPYMLSIIELDDRVILPVTIEYSE